MRAITTASLAACLIALDATAGFAQVTTYGGGTTSRNLPAPTVVRMPVTMGAATSGSAPNAIEQNTFRPGEEVSTPMTPAERKIANEQIHIARANAAQAYLKKFGPGHTVHLRRPKY